MMESSRPCQSCYSKSLITDPDTGQLICSSCGIVQNYIDFQHQTWDSAADAPSGVLVRVGDVGNYSYRETKVYLAKKVVDEILSKLGLEGRTDQVNVMIRDVTDGEYGQGDWFSVLVGACAYVIMRMDDKPLALNKVAGPLGCDAYELGRMVFRVVDFLDLKLPEVDIVRLFDRASTNLLSNRTVGKETRDRMLKQGIFLIQCLIKWCVTTGRRPGPVVAAVFVFVAKLNGVDADIDGVAKDLEVAAFTCRKRYKELLERLVNVANVNLPWGKDVNVKNIMKNAPVVIQFMERKSMCKVTGEKERFGSVGIDVNGLVGECLTKELEYGIDDHDSDENENNSKYFGSTSSTSWTEEDLKKLRVSHECLSTIYLKYMDEASNLKSTRKRTGDNRRTKKKRNYSMGISECWRGDSEMSKKLFIEKLLEKDVGLNPLPPSFVTGCLSYDKRREKIKAAKIRIEKIRCPSAAADSGAGDDPCLSKSINFVQKKRKNVQVDIDWEDFVIETLLLHQVSEEEIEKGFYNTLLDLHVFNL